MGNENGLQHIHNVMHVFIEGLAAGIYDSVEDIQQDAKEYLAMEKAVEKLSKWDKTSEVDDLVNIFDGLSNSIAKRKEHEEEEKVWENINTMPDLGDKNVK